jgi:hypothetical protein
MVRAHPDDANSSTHFRVRHDKVHETGNVTLRYDSRLYHVGIPRALAGEVVSNPRDVRVLKIDGELIRRFELDPTRNYQPLSLDPLSRSTELDRRRKRQPDLFGQLSLDATADRLLESGRTNGAIVVGPTRSLASVRGPRGPLHSPSPWSSTRR